MSRKVPVAAVLVTAAVALFLWDVLLAGQTFYLRDVLFDALPWRRFAADAIARGELPLWNPHSRFGQPFLANPQAAVLYPPHLLFVALPTAWAFKGNLFLHLLLGGVSMAALLRRLRLHDVAAALGGISWALGGYSVANLEFMSVMETLAWCPLTVLLAVRLGDPPDGRRPLRSLVLRGGALAAVVSVAFLAGQVQPLAFTLLIAAALATTRALDVPNGAARRVAVTAAALVGSLVVAAGLTAVQWMPTRELLPLSIRAEGVDPGLGIASAQPRHLLHLLLPFASGHPGAASWDGGTLFEFWLGSIYGGLLPAALVPAAFTLWRDAGFRRVLVACTALVLLGVLLALGGHAPLYPLLLDVVPQLGLLRWPAKAFQLVVFAMCVLAALGMHAALRGGHGQRVALAGSVVVLLAVLGMWLAGTAGAARGALFAALGVAVVAALGTARVPLRVAVAAALALLVADLRGVSREIQLVGDDRVLDALPDSVPPLRGGRVHTDYTYAQFATYGSRRTRDFRLALDLLAGDSGLSLPVDRTYGGDALQVAATREITDLLDRLEGPGRERLLRVLGVEQVLEGASFEEVRESSGASRWRSVAGALPRARIVTRWRAETDRVAAMERLLAPGFDPAAEAIVDAADVPPARPRRGSARIEAAELARESLALDVHVERPALLVVSDTWFPGWVARVDGEEREIVVANAIFRGVFLRPGDREVRMTYEPRAFRGGAVWTAFTALALLALCAAVALPRRAPRAGAA